MSLISIIRSIDSCKSEASVCEYMKYLTVDSLLHGINDPDSEFCCLPHYPYSPSIMFLIVHIVFPFLEATCNLGEIASSDLHLHYTDQTCFITYAKGFNSLLLIRAIHPSHIPADDIIHIIPHRSMLHYLDSHHSLLPHSLFAFPRYFDQAHQKHCK